MGLNIGHTDDGEPFVLPDTLLTSTVAILAKKGAGKTYAAGVLEEEFAERGLPFIVLDPVGVHYGIRSKASGRRSGYPIIVIGGEHGDVPIERTMGAQVAEAVVEENISCIIDLSELSKGAWRQFTRDFCRELYRRNKNTSPRHVFIEEATEFVPQRMRPEMLETFEAVERLVRLGRNRGLGATLIAQRSAQISKDVLSQIDVLIALRTVGPHDRKALLDMFEGVLEEDDMENLDQFKREMPKLEDGVAWVWSPEFLKVFTRIKIRERTTFHGGATAQVAEVQLVQAKPDVSALRKRLAPPPEEVKLKDAPPGAIKTIKGETCNHQEEIDRLKAANTASEQQFQDKVEKVARLLTDVDALKQDMATLRSETASKLAATTKFQGALREFMNFGPPSEEGTYVAFDEEEFLQKVLARIPTNGQTVQVTPPEALRKKYLKQVVDRLYKRLEPLDVLPRRAMELLLSNDRFWPVTVISKTLTGQDGGAGFTNTQQAMKTLLDFGLVQKGGSGGKQYKAIVGVLVRSELKDQTPTDQEVDQVVQHVLAKVVTG